jgi:hypothetical protein
MNLENGKWKLDNVNVRISNCIAYPDKNGIIIKNLDQETLDFFDNLKQDLVNKIPSKQIYGFQKTKSCLEEFYCNPVKKDYLKINKGDVPFDSIIDTEIFVSGVWFSDKSWGPYLIAKSLKESEFLFIEDSDSGPDI